MKHVKVKFCSLWVFAAVLVLLVMPLSTVNLSAFAQTSPSSSPPPFTRVTSPNSAQLANRDKAVSSMGNVFGFDMSKYKVTLTNDYLLSQQMYPQYGGDLTPEQIDYNLTSADGNTIMVNALFWTSSAICYQFDYYGNATGNVASPYYAQPMPTTLSEKTIAFLSRYQSFTGASYIQPMLSTLNANILDGNVSASVTENNVKTTLSVNSYETEISWVPSFNGVDFPNGMSISFINGQVVAFADYWTLYKIGSTSVNISRDEAISEAWQIANNMTTVNFGGVGNVTIKFIDNPTVELVGCVRDNMTAYPQYGIFFPTDQIYYTVDGINVGIWADNGQVAGAQLDGWEGAASVPNVQPNPTASSSSSPTPASTPTLTQSSLTEPIFVIAGSTAIVAIAVVAIVIRKRH